MLFPESPNNAAFRQFEHSGWQKVASRYHDYFSNLTTQTIPRLLDAVEVKGPMRLLDVASGPGYVGAAAERQSANSFGVDFSASMVALAMRQFPAVRFSVGDAEQLPFAGSSFDAVVSNFGLLHMARPDQALAEAHRVLRPGGRVGFTVWARPEEAVAFGIILRAIEAYGDPNAPLPPGPPFFRFSDPEECVRTLHEAGFREPRMSQIPLVWKLRSSEDFLDAMESATVRTGGLLRAQSRESLDAIRNAVRDAAKPYEKDGGIELPMPAVLAVAMKA